MVFMSVLMWVLFGIVCFCSCSNMLFFEFVVVCLCCVRVVARVWCCVCLIECIFRLRGCVSIWLGFDLCFSVCCLSAMLLFTCARCCLMACVFA